MRAATTATPISSERWVTIEDADDANSEKADEVDRDHSIRQTRADHQAPDRGQQGDAKHGSGDEEEPVGRIVIERDELDHRVASMILRSNPDLISCTASDGSSTCMKCTNIWRLSAETSRVRVPGVSVIRFASSVISGSVSGSSGTARIAGRSVQAGNRVGDPDVRLDEFFGQEQKEGGDGPEAHRVRPTGI